MSEFRPDSVGGEGDVVEPPAVELSVVAVSTYLSTVSAVAADLALQHDMNLDEVDDLRLAVDEACSMLVPLALPDAMLRCRFTIGPDRIEVSCSVSTKDEEQLTTTGFSWQVLTTLADTVEWSAGHDDEGYLVTVDLVKRKAAA